MFYRITDSKFKTITFTKDLKDVPKVAAFRSTYLYNQEAVDAWKKTGSVAGITDVITDQLWWDIDHENLTEAKASTIKLIKKLMVEGYDVNSIDVRFSGSKGFHVLLTTDKTFTPKQVQAYCAQVSDGISGIDSTLYDASQILRIPNTINKKSNLYCIQVNPKVLDIISITDIQKRAETPQEFLEKPPVVFNKNVISVVEGERKSFDLTTLDYQKKPEFLDNARWALQNGFFYGSASKAVGDRTQAFLCLAATYKNIGFAKEHTYRLLKGVAELQAERTGEERFSDVELWNGTIKSVYSATWKGGVFSVHNKGSWLYNYAKEYGIDVGDELVPVETFSSIASEFSDYVSNIEENTIKTGLAPLDELVPLTVGMNLGVLGAPGAGKTALALDILESTSKNGVCGVFASLDMYRTRIFEKVIYRLTGLSRKEVYEIFQKDEKRKAEILAKVESHYENVFFFDKPGATPDDISRFISDTEKQTGKKIKYVLIDYFERVGTDIADTNASNVHVFNGIQNLITRHKIAAITLLQPNKSGYSGGPDTPLLNYANIKGSSIMSQGCRAIISVWRPFYNPTWKDFDNYMQVGVLKNDLGELGILNFGWEGKRGLISVLTPEKRERLMQLIAQKEESEKEKKEDRKAAW